MQVKTLIAEKLAAAFAPQSLDVVDKSHRHEGHAGHRRDPQRGDVVALPAQHLKRKPWNVKLWPTSGIERASWRTRPAMVTASSSGSCQSMSG